MQTSHGLLTDVQLYMWGKDHGGIFETYTLIGCRFSPLRVMLRPLINIFKKGSGPFPLKQLSRNHVCKI
jgi:hypothetical protein